MSRKDRILALAIGNNASKSAPSSSKNIATAPKQINPVPTDVSEIWSRPYDFNDFPVVFDYQNEYSNSSRSAQETCLTKLKVPSPKNYRLTTRSSLTCYETLASSDEDINNSKDMFEDSDDSVLDKDYLPQPQHTSYASSDSDIEYIHGISHMGQISVHTDVHLTVNNIESNAEIINNLTEIQAPLSQVNISLQREAEVTLNDINTTNQTQESLSQPNISLEKEKEINTDEIIECFQIEIQQELPTEIEQDVSTEPAVSENGKGLTKAGLPRKRNVMDTPLAERKRQKKEEQDEKLSLKPPCDDTCRQKCTNKFTENMRKEIHDRYVKLNWESRGLFIKGMVEPKRVKCRTTETTPETSKRNVSYIYHFFANAEKTPVCKRFFLTTLGYNANNDRRVNLALNKEIDNQKDNRGSYQRTNVIDKDVIREHINSFEPSISHYRREHAPKKLYLPSDLNATLLYNNFKIIHPSAKVSVETYRKILKNMNISFAHLGHEECEQCLLSKQHKDSCDGSDCTLCTQYNKHTLQYTQSREEYQSDVKESAKSKDIIFYSVDLQKVIMLPRMDQFKSAIFCPRIITFNESFVPLGPTTLENMPFAVLWHEAVSGRRCEDIQSAYRAFFLSKRDVKHFVFWADNCAAQNKNWAFLCFLVNIINSELIAAESITIKYFEPGHSFMSADHFHHQVELSLKKKNKVYDFGDFVESVQMANSNKTVVKILNISDFYNYEDLSSQHRVRNQKDRVYLKDIVAIKVERREFTLKFKTSYDETEWKRLHFLQMKIEKQRKFPGVKCKSGPRGITSERKSQKIHKLLPLMPETRRDFWINLPVCSATTDIVENDVD